MIDDPKNSNSFTAEQMEIFVEYDKLVTLHLETVIKMAQVQLAILKHLQLSLNDITSLQTKVDTLEQQLKSIKMLVANPPQ